MTDNEKNSATDNEIIKALNRWTNNFEGKVTELAILCNALDLINRQKEQIESLIAGQETLQKYIAEKDAEIEKLRKQASNSHDVMMNIVKANGG